MICETWTTHFQVFVSFLILLVTLLEADSKVDDRLDNRLYFSSVEPEEEEYRADPVEPTYDWDYASDYFLNSVFPDHARSSNQTLSGGVQSPDGLQSPGGLHSPDGGSAPNSEIGESKLPTAIIIGVKKGGTRALLEFLRVHPDVRAPGPEIHFFDRNYDKGLEWYRKHMPHTNEHQITIEKTPSYFVTKSVPARVYNMSREVRLILVVRDPVTRAISDYTQAKTKRPDLLSFSQMAFLDNTTHGPVATSWGAVKIGIYAKHLERWLRYFPLNQFHFVHGERLISDPAGELALLQDFLGLKRVITEKYFYFDSAKGFPCLKVKDTELAALAYVKSNASAPHCLGKTKGRTHPLIDEKVLQRLRNFYRPFNQKFYQLTGINFGWP